MQRLDEFMAAANAAYYARRDPYADFTTAPEITQAFGEVLGAWAADTWAAHRRARTRCCSPRPGRAAAR